MVWDEGTKVIGDGNGGVGGRYVDIMPTYNKNKRNIKAGIFLVYKIDIVHVQTQILLAFYG